RKVSTLEKGPGSEPALTQPSSPGRGNASGAGFSPGKVNFGMEGGLAIFRSESKGPFPDAQFRVDEARLFVEAPIWKDVYFFSEINITTREDPNTSLQAGEIYVDFEHISRLWN